MLSKISRTQSSIKRYRFSVVCTSQTIVDYHYSIRVRDMYRIKEMR